MVWKDKGFEKQFVLMLLWRVQNLSSDMIFMTPFYLSAIGKKVCNAVFPRKQAVTVPHKVAYGWCATWFSLGIKPLAIGTNYTMCPVFRAAMQGSCQCPYTRLLHHTWNSPSYMFNFIKTFFRCLYFCDDHGQPKIFRRKVLRFIFPDL